MTATKGKARLNHADVSELHAIRAHYGRSWAAKKRQLLRRASGRAIEEPRVLMEYHETLLFLAAYPDDRGIARLVDRELGRLARAAKALVRASRQAGRRLENSGIANTDVTCCYSLDLLGWLVERFPNAIEPAWDEESLGESFDEFLSELASRVEADGLLTDRLSTREWVRLAKGKAGGELAWLVGRFQRLRASEGLRDRLFEGLEIRARWRLGAAASRTLGRLPRASKFFHTAGIHKLGSLRDEIARPIGRPRHAGAAEAGNLMDVVRAALAVRERETDAATYPQFQEILHWRLDRGFEVVLYGMAPERRLPIESFYGFLLTKNGVPMGYGGGWIFFDRCEIGVNIFDSFRGGESAYGFAQVMRVFRHFFRATRFTVDPYQFGDGNNEAIKSGAFWFYYRLGFRPLQRRLDALAASEWSRIEADRTYRSPAGILRRLAKAHIALDVAGPVEALPELCDLGLAATKWIGRRFDGDREAAELWSERRLTRVLGVRVERLGPSERMAFRRLGVLAAMIDGLERWPRSARSALGRVLCAKGGTREAHYSRLLLQHERLRSAWARLAGMGARIHPAQEAK